MFKQKRKTEIVLCSLILLVLAGCSNLVSTLTTNRDSSSSGEARYGTLIITEGSSGRSVYTAGITKAVITVSSSDIETGSEPTATATVTGGAADNITVEKIPVGKNRIVTVQAYNESTKINGITIRAVTDIAAGNNNVTVNWDTTAAGNVYYDLSSDGVAVAELTDAEEKTIAAAIPAGVSAPLVDAASIASDYKAGSLDSSSSYKLTAATLTFTCYQADGFTAQVGDPSSTAVTGRTAGSEVTVTGIAPGTWPLYILDSDGTVVAKKALTFTSGTETAAGTLPYDGILVVTAKGSYPLIHYWSCSNAAAYPDTTWPGTEMTAVGNYYEYGFNGVSSVSCLVTNSSKVKLCNSDMTMSVKGIYIVTSSGASLIGGTTPTDVSAPAVTISPSSSIALDGKITVTLDDGNETITAATVSAVCGTTTKNYTYSDFTSDVLTIPVSDLTTESGATISVSASAVNAEGTGSSSAKITTDEDSSVKIYISAASAPTIWVWQPSGLACCTLMGYTWTSQPTMSDATGLNYEDGWYVFTVPEADYTAGKAFSFILNSGSTVTTAKTATFWYDAAGSVGTAGTYYDSDPTTAPTPVAPSATITPSTGSFLPLKGSIVITLNNGYSTISSAAVTVKNTTQNTSLTYRYSDFTSDKLSISVPKISAAAGDTVTVSVSVTNAVSTIPVSASYTTEDVAVDKFTWDNALVYFVLTDRFYNGDTSNDHSYNRVNNSTSSSVPDVATFHGGDIEGLTDKIDYIASLGVNAIWITAPYEQIHGWVSGKDNKFPHYAFHGYYTLDWTEMDKNMGTVEQFRTFVKAAHNKGIRVIMDIVMNHTGYNTVEDMITYNFGSFSGGTPAHGWIASTNGTWQANTNGTWSVLWGDGSSNGEGWEKWWCSWVRAFNGLYGYQTPGSSDETMSLAGLPDVYTESSAAVSIPTFLAKKWSDEGSDNSAWRVPAAADYRVNVSGFSPHDYTEHWLASWVREFGVDGFRVDTAKHVERVRWGELKDLCQSALEAWRADSTRTSGDAAKDWTQNFWMTGECFGWTSLAGAGEYYTTGKFDSMINFSFNGSSGNHSGSVPTTSTWATYANALNGSNAKDSDSNGNHNNVLSYISSHDTGLTRTSDQSSVGTMLCLLPGGVQIFYGDESSRGSDYSSYGDTDMETRTDMNWSGVTGTYAGQVAHWGKVGTFRKNHPAVGAGTQTTIEDGTYGRTYSGTAGDDRVVIHAGSASKVKVSGFFDDGTEVENSYTGETATVSNGSVTFATASNPVLIEAVE